MINLGELLLCLLTRSFVTASSDTRWSCKPVFDKYRCCAVSAAKASQDAVMDKKKKKKPSCCYSLSSSRYAGIWKTCPSVSYISRSFGVFRLWSHPCMRNFSQCCIFLLAVLINFDCFGFFQTFKKLFRNVSTIKPVAPQDFGDTSNGSITQHWCLFPSFLLL